MARSTSDIQNQIIATKEADPILSALTSTSKVAEWRLWTYVIAFAIHILEKMWDSFRDETEDYVARSRVHGLRWYRDTVLEFQEGKELNWMDNGFSYPELSQGESLNELQIVKQAAVVEAPGGLLVKVATVVNGNLQPVTDDQADRIGVYMNEVKDAGNKIKIINHEPDELEVMGVIYVDPLLINLEDGSLVSESTVFPILEAANNYINDENDQNFNGSFRRTHFVDTLQKATGVKDPVITSVKARYGVIPFEEIPVSYLPFSGYFKIVNTSFEYLPYE